VKTLGVLFCGGFLLAGCGVARNAAVSSYHVATAPVTIVRRQFNGPPRQTTSDVNIPGRPMATPPPNLPRQTVAETSATQGTKRSQPSPSPRMVASQSEFPVAKSVPGKPGYVYSPYDQSKYVDVSGYTPGSKVKDPYTQKIFVVP
jgi:hypothetical protein